MTTLAVTKGLAIATSLVAGGANSVVSLIAVPALLSAPHTIAAKQFKLMHGIGSLIQPSSTLLAALLHGFAAYRLHQSGSGAWSRWAAAAALSSAILPLTIALMEPTSRQLLAIAGTSEKREGGTEISVKTEGLLRRWNVLNAVRGLLAVSAGAIGLWTVLDEY
ncbi:hypothetical protein B0T17DRAFT_611574 [Bombardia bombarda]|uniref:DUF1772-domain-containing protein n=1 Tax=Bombardia bombarda TaxID=252184 RepID=A0AA39XIE5_9PEZI|nr:hypothetical protein B0T17DRAFT_611574 [Bombardia bombarda]